MRVRRPGHFPFFLRGGIQWTLALADLEAVAFILRLPPPREQVPFQPRSRHEFVDDLPRGGAVVDFVFGSRA
ncbi:hypothetical protein BJY01DRAFT_210833 [Aspergillus pseudoustus]|uniref:Uncharacterized protein n=1 Tax=Aspergillus pseudoustus TaxID=1810923 RepID=A0ABR4KA84_9EURO